MSLKAGGVGINLTEADYVYLVDPWWNPAVEQQAIDRTHRIGQKNNVRYILFYCKGTVEEKILSALREKKQLSDEILNNITNYVKEGMKI